VRPRADRQTHTQTSVTTIQFASSTTHAARNVFIRLERVLYFETSTHRFGVKVTDGERTKRVRKSTSSTSLIGEVDCTAGLLAPLCCLVFMTGSHDHTTSASTPVRQLIPYFSFQPFPYYTPMCLCSAYFINKAATDTVYMK